MQMKTVKDIPDLADVNPKTILLDATPVTQIIVEEPNKCSVDIQIHQPQH
jgi:hypothetical protein